MFHACATQELFIDLPDKKPSPDTESEAEDAAIKERVKRTPVPEPSTTPRVNDNGNGTPADAKHLKVPDGQLPNVEKKPELSRGQPLTDATATPPPQDLEPKSSTSRAEEIKSRMNELKKSIEFLVLMCFFSSSWPHKSIYIRITLQACILYTCVVAMLRQRSG